ncbi:MAG: multidrug transporter MatE [Ignavibacteria bacterium GWB2_35_6b]|nr:MAG: multidrug transporter MatE [Ignavibacteria bacterium GWB2_35_6b]
MKTKIQKWGNSLAVRIPKSFAKEINLNEEDNVELSINDFKLIIEPLKLTKYKLDKIVSLINENNIHYETEFGNPEGKELM